MYYRVPVRGRTKRPGILERISGLGQTDPAAYSDPMTTDTSVTSTSPDFSFTVDTSMLPAPPVLEAPTAPPSSGSGLTDFFSAITQGAQAATAVYSAADLIQINQQRAKYGMLPINQYGQIGTATGVTKTTSGAFGLSWPVLLIGGGLVAVLLLRR